MVGKGTFLSHIQALEQGPLLYLFPGHHSSGCCVKTIKKYKWTKFAEGRINSAIKIPLQKSKLQCCCSHCRSKQNIG